MVDSCLNRAWVKKASTMGGRVALIALVGVAMACFPTEANAYTDEQLATAIWYSEGGARAVKPYGILSVKVSGAEEARRVCLRTIANNRVRWQKAGAKGDYLEFLANRYCPVGAENDNGTNKYWLKNVRYYLSRMEA